MSIRFRGGFNGHGTTEIVKYGRVWNKFKKELLNQFVIILSKNIIS